MNPHDFDDTIMHMVHEKAKALEDQLASDVIYYTGQIHPQYFKVFRNFVEEVKRESKRTENAVSIVLRTPGGSAETAERYVDVVRTNYNTVNFVVPDAAMSAGTIFCMSGDNIYMDYSSALGPIDPQVMTPDGSGYVAALGYLDKVEELSKKAKLSPADVVLLRGLDLAKLALYEQARDLSTDLLKRWLVQYKFKNWTQHRTRNVGTPVTPEEKAARAEEIATALSDNRLWHSHGRAINLKTLRELGLEVMDYTANAPLRDAVREYNDLLTAYIDRAGLTFFVHSHLTHAI